MQINLSGKKILLGVTGSISIYKSCEIVREFIKADAEVFVVMSQSATKFISPLTFEALTRNRVLTDTNEEWSSSLNHIDLAKLADVFLIAPATANTLNKLSNGIADNLLLQIALAFNKEIIIAPSANTNMLSNHYTKTSIKMLKVNDYHIISTQNKLLACGDKGEGALAEPKDIFYNTSKLVLKDDFWENRRVVITGGGTVEKIDEVRYISNFSSGKMAEALALALYLRGADVCYITTVSPKTLPKELYVIEVESAKEMFEYTQDAIRVAKKGVMIKSSLNNDSSLIQKKPFLFMVSAVSDFTPKFPQIGKLKKQDLGKEWNLELKESIDILKSLNKDGIITIGFKAEMSSENGLQNAKKALIEKGVNGICFNLLKDSSSFGADENKISFITKDKVIDLEKESKIDISFKILEEAKELDING